MWSQLTFTWRYFAFDRIEESNVDVFYYHMMLFIICLQCFVFLLKSQVWAESSNDAQVFLAAGLHGHHPALTRSDQVFLLLPAASKLTHNFHIFDIYIFIFYIHIYMSVL